MAQEFEFARFPYQAPAPLEEATLIDWETASGVRLPADYRAFLLKTNGGALRPNTFDLVLPECPITDNVHAVVRLFDWDEVLEESQEEIEPALRNLPPGYLAIGVTSTELTLLLSILPPNPGTIHAWVSDTMNAWGEAENNVVVPVALTFTAFLDALRLDSKGETYQAYWTGHDRKGLVASRLVLP